MIDELVDELEVADEYESQCVCISTGNLREIIHHLEQAEKVKDAAQNVLLHRGSNASLSILRRTLSQTKGDL